jgi:hypothetical protein
VWHFPSQLTRASRFSGNPCRPFPKSLIKLRTRNPHTRRLTMFGIANRVFAMTSAAGTVRFNPASYRVAENAGEVRLWVVRVDDLAAIVTVDFATTDGTAKAGD